MENYVPSKVDDSLNTCLNLLKLINWSRLLENYLEKTKTCSSKRTSRARERRKKRKPRQERKRERRRKKERTI